MPHQSTFPVVATVLFYVGLGALLFGAARLLQRHSGPLEWTLVLGGMAVVAVSIWTSVRAAKGDRPHGDAR